MLDYLNLPNLTTLRVQEISTNEILVDAEGGHPPQACSDPACAQGKMLGHGSNEIIVHDIPRDGKWVRIRLRRRRVRCSVCGKTVSYLVNSFDQTRNMTFRLLSDIERNCLQETYASIARRVGVDESTVRAVANDLIADLERRRKHSVRPPSVLGLDEFVIYKKPCAILTNIEAQTIYDVLETRTYPHLRPALEEIVSSGQLEVVVTDMFEAYLKLLAKIAPKTPVVIDRFHVVRMANDAMDEVRKRVQKTLAPDDRKRLTRERGLFLSNEANLTPEALLCREAWFVTAPALKDACEARQAYHAIYHCTTRAEADREFQSWRNSLPETVKREFRRTGYAFGANREQILNYFDHRYTAGFTESVNRLAKDMNRLGRGYSWEVLRARLLHHRYARDCGAKKLKKRTIEYLGYFATGAAHEMKTRTRWTTVDGDWGTDVAALLSAIREFPDYSPDQGDEDTFNLSEPGLPGHDAQAG